MHFLEMAEQAPAVIPGRPARTIYHVVARERAHRDESDVMNLELLGEVSKLLSNLIESLLGVIDEIHLVHADHEMGNAQERGHETMPPRLLLKALAHIHQQ